MKIQSNISFNGKILKSLNKKKGGVSSRGSNNLLYGTLIGLATMIPLTSPAVSKNEERTNIEIVDDDNHSILFKENGNGVIDKDDFEYSTSQARQNSVKYLKGLMYYSGQKWSQATLDLAHNLQNVYNRANVYSYDLNNDEMVKDKAYITYDKQGRITSTTVVTPYGSKDIVKYKYNKSGGIDKAEYKDNALIEYRKDGTRFSAHYKLGGGADELCRYNKKGKLIARSVHSPENYIFIKYDGNDNIIEEFSRSSVGATNKIYNNGALMFETKYSSKGAVENYVDRYFSHDVDNSLRVESAYFNKSVKISPSADTNEANFYPRYYNTTPIDGHITGYVRQGTSGTCYISGIVNSMARIDAGRMLLDNTVIDKGGNTVDVRFRGLERQYRFNKDYIYRNISRLGRKDGDYPALVKGYENYRLEDLTEEEKARLPKEFFIRGDDGDMVDSGFPNEFFFALTGKDMYQSEDKISDRDIKMAEDCLRTGRGVVNAGTLMQETKDNEIPDSERALGIVPHHNISVLGINTERGTVTMYDAVTEQEITNYPISKFKKYFSKLYWATVD